MAETTDRDPSVPLSAEERAEAQRAYDTRVAAISGFPAPYYGDTEASDPPYKRHLNAYLDGDAGGTVNLEGASTPESDNRSAVPGPGTPVPDNTPVTTKTDDKSSS